MVFFYYSLIFFAIIFIQSVAGKQLAKNSILKNGVTLPIVLFFVCLFSTVAFDLNSMIIIPFIILYFYFQRFYTLLIDTNLNTIISDNVRSTVLSINSSLMRVVIIVTSPLIAYLVNIDLNYIFWIGILLFAAYIIHSIYKSHQQRTAANRRQT